MSYEGHVQYWCKKGHCFEVPETVTVHGVYKIPERRR